jgi:hypothetical protein
MPLASSTMHKKFSLLLLCALLASGVLHAQTENSPYSRYGLGDLLPSQNIMSRGIGGVSAAYADIISVNFTNPASYSRLKRSTLDFAVELNSRTLSAINPPRKYNSVSPIISYVQLGLPLSQARNWGMNIGLRPVTRINYKIEENARIPEVDSSHTLYEGSGGTYEVYLGTGFAVVKNLSVGINVGYLFGTKEYYTRRTFIPDSSFKQYYGSEHSSRSNFGGLFANAGFQYTIPITKKDMVRIGAHGTLRNKYNATQNNRVMTFQETSTGIDSIDVVFDEESSNNVVYPGSFGVGVMYYGGDKWLIGADFSQSKWSQYEFFGEKDMVTDSWKFQMGGQILPNLTGAKSYWGRVTYRAGFFVGRDYIKADNELPMWGASIGFGLPMRPPSYSNQYSIINTSFEFGQRGNNANAIRENFFRLGLGFTLSDIWFIKRRYD